MKWPAAGSIVDAYRQRAHSVRSTPGTSRDTAPACRCSTPGHRRALLPPKCAEPGHRIRPRNHASGTHARRAGEIMRRVAEAALCPTGTDIRFALSGPNCTFGDRVALLRDPVLHVDLARRNRAGGARAVGGGDVEAARRVESRGGRKRRRLRPRDQMNGAPALSGESRATARARARPRPEPGTRSGWPPAGPRTASRSRPIVRRSAHRRTR